MLQDAEDVLQMLNTLRDRQRQALFQEASAQVGASRAGGGSGFTYERGEVDGHAFRPGSEDQQQRQQGVAAGGDAEMGGNFGGVAQQQGSQVKNEDAVPGIKIEGQQS